MTSYASSTVTRILDTARISLPGVLDGAVRNELFNVLKEFSQRSDCWKAEIAVPVNPSYREYTLDLGEDAFINRLLFLEGARINSAVTLSGNAPLNYGPPMAGHLREVGAKTASLEIHTLPNAAEIWYAHVALAVADPTDTNGLPIFPKWLLEKYQSAIMSGLIARIAAQPAKPYSNIKIAAIHERRFNNGITAAKVDTLHGFTKGGQCWSFPQGARSRTQRTTGWR